RPNAFNTFFGFAASSLVAISFILNSCDAARRAANKVQESRLVKITIRFCDSLQAQPKPEFLSPQFLPLHLLYRSRPNLGYWLFCYRLSHRPAELRRSPSAAPAIRPIRPIRPFSPSVL